MSRTASALARIAVSSRQPFRRLVSVMWSVMSFRHQARSVTHSKLLLEAALVHLSVCLPHELTGSVELYLDQSPQQSCKMHAAGIVLVPQSAAAGGALVQRD